MVAFQWFNLCTVNIIVWHAVQAVSFYHAHVYSNIAIMFSDMVHWRSSTI